MGSVRFLGFVGPMRAIGICWIRVVLGVHGKGGVPTVVGPWHLWSSWGSKRILGSVRLLGSVHWVLRFVGSAQLPLRLIGVCIISGVVASVELGGLNPKSD